MTAPTRAIARDATTPARRQIAIGTAGWSIPRAHAAAFPPTGTQLERYAAVLPAVEINSSFYRPHRRATYERWAAATPADFRFAVKLPKRISHERRLVDAGDACDAFVDQVCGLGAKLGVILVQLPPSLAFAPDVAPAFLEGLRGRLVDAVGIACEPRHASWFTPHVDDRLAALGVARVAADPARVPGGDRPGGWRGLAYHRLHGSPEIYRSSYDDGRLDPIAAALGQARSAGADCWCVFDNTASGAAAGDALALLRRLDG